MDLKNRLSSCNLNEVEMVDQKNLSELTTFKVGGPADLVLCAKNKEQLKEIINILKDEKSSWMILGKGSNLLVTDSGVEGVVILLRGDFCSHEIFDSNRFFCGAGADLSEVSRIAASHNLTGLEFAVGIPGTFGGGIFMNAGAYDGELSKVIESVTWMDSTGNIQIIPVQNCDFEYRKSIFQKKSGIILGATVFLEPGTKENILTKMRELTQQRNTKQPMEWPSAGSTFKRPPGYFAGTLIQEAGLKGFTVGGAQVSEKHSGFMINHNNATASDVLHLIKEVRERVFKYAGVWLIPEVRIVGREKEEWDFLYRDSSK